MKEVIELKTKKANDLSDEKITLNERVDNIFKSGWVNEFEYLTNLMQDTRGLLYELQQENKHLKEKIDILIEDNSQLEDIRVKAIEYIKENTLIDYYGMPCFNNQKNVEKLLEILGDKE